MQITDTHAHIYSLDEVRYPMIENPLRPPPGTGTIEHLQREMASNGVERVVAIHTSTAYRWDNRFITDSARDNAPWMVGVCTLDPEDPGSPALLRRYVADCNIRGMRSVPAGATQSQLDHPGVDALWTTAEELGIPINVLIHLNLADELEVLLQTARGPARGPRPLHVSPRQGGPGRGDDPARPGPGALSQPATPSSPGSWIARTGRIPLSDTYPLLRAVVDAYGAERCVWGSDFPCELWTPKASYARHFELFTEASGLNAATLETILSITPGRLWFGQQ